MNRILKAILLLILSVTIISCDTSSQSYYKKMDAIEEPFQIDISNNIFETEYVWVTHQYVLNEYEILYYAPESYRTEEQIYLNGEEVYFILRLGIGLQSDEATICESETLKEIFRE